MNLICSKFLEAAEFKKDQILFGRCLEDNKDDADFMIVPLGDTIEKLRSKFEKKNDAIAIAKEKKAILYSSNLDFYIIGHPNFKDGNKVIQKCTCGKVCEPENLKEDCRNRNEKIEKMFHVDIPVI